MADYTLNILKSYKHFYDLYENGSIFCAFDTETTGLHPSTDRIIEIGAVKFSRNGIIDRFSALINPGTELPPLCTQISSITDEMLKDKPPLSSVLPDFMAFIYGSILVAHNAQFDIRFVNEELIRTRQEPLKNKAIDTLLLSKIVLPENKTWKQTALADQFGINIESAHRAYDDARVCMEVFIKLITLQNKAKKKISRGELWLDL